MTISVSMKMTPKQAGQLTIQHMDALLDNQLIKIQELEDKLKMAYLLNRESIDDFNVYKGYQIWLENLGAAILRHVDAIKEFDSIEGDSE